jgi:hypothetical protein
MSEAAVLELIRREIPVAVAAALATVSAPGGKRAFVCFAQWYARVGIWGLVGATCRRAWHSCLSAPPRSLPLSLPSIPLIPASVAVAGRSGRLTTTITSFSLPKATIPISGGSGGTDTEPSAFKLSSSFAPVPAKLVKWIQAMEFAEMRELLSDNIAFGENCWENGRSEETAPC